MIASHSFQHTLLKCGVRRQHVSAMGRMLGVSLIVTLSVFSRGVQCQQPNATPPGASAPGAPDSGDLAMRSNDPTSSLRQFQLLDSFYPTYYGADGQGNDFLVRPVLPFAPHEWWPANIMRPEVPVMSAPNGRTGLGDTTVLDVAIFPISHKLKLGFGPILIAPTASNSFVGQGKWQLGPSILGVFTGPKGLIVGSILENPVSFAGQSKRSDVNELVVQPIIVKMFAKGLYLREDPILIFDWEHGGAGTVPVNLGLGRIFKLGQQPVNAYVQTEWNVHRPTYAGESAPRFTARFSLTYLFPEKKK